jgi:hypothetical protein
MAQEPKEIDLKTLEPLLEALAEFAHNAKARI